MDEPTPMAILEAVLANENMWIRDKLSEVQQQLDRSFIEGVAEGRVLERERIKASRKHLGAWEAAGKPRPVYVIPDWVFDAD